MFKRFIGAAVLALAPIGVQASTIDLADLKLIPQDPVYTGGGGLIFEDGRSNLLSDNANMMLDGFANSALLLTFSDALTNLVSISYDADNSEQFDVTAVGENGDDMFELLLERTSSRYSGTNVGLGANAIIRFTSDDFDFAQDAPFDFFAGVGFAEYDDVRFSATSLFAVPMAAVPISPGILLLMTGVAGLGMARQRRKS